MASTKKASKPARAAKRGISVKLKPKLSIAQARTLQAQLNKALGGGRSIVLDGCKVERTDTASLQLLCAFFDTSRAAGVDVKWKRGTTQVLHDDAAMLGLAEHLDLLS